MTQNIIHHLEVVEIHQCTIIHHKNTQYPNVQYKGYCTFRFANNFGLRSPKATFTSIHNNTYWVLQPVNEMIIVFFVIIVIISSFNDCIVEKDIVVPHGIMVLRL